MYEIRCKQIDEFTVKQEYAFNSKKQEQESKYTVKQWNSVCLNYRKQSYKMQPLSQYWDAEQKWVYFLRGCSVGHEL